MHRLLAFSIIAVLAGCTYLPQQDHSEEAAVHGSVLPATVICLISACDAVFSDRAERAGETVNTEGDIEADQKADEEPSLSIPGLGGL